MPMVIPIVVAFASVGAGVVTGYAAFAMVAGAVLTGVGSLTGNKDLMKIGAVLSVVGGVANLAGAASGAAGSAEAVSGMDLAADAGAAGANSVDAAAAAAGGVAYDAGAAVEAMAPVAAPATDPMVGFPETAAQAPPPTEVGIAPPPAVQADPTSLAPATGGDSTSFLQRAQAAQQPTDALGAQSPQTQMVTPTVQAPSGVNPTVADTASKTTSTEISSWLQKARTAGKGVAEFMQKNPELLKIGGSILSNMYGPNAERLDMEKSFMERARANLNSPIAMRYNKGA